MTGAGRAVRRQLAIDVGYAVGRDTETRVMMETTPVTSFTIPKSQFPLEFFVVPFNPPATHDRVDHRLPVDVYRRVAEPVVDRLLRIVRPLDGEPFFCMGLIVMRRLDTDLGKARLQRLGQNAECNRLMILIA